jgi:hypothetical protein
MPPFANTGHRICKKCRLCASFLMDQTARDADWWIYMEISRLIRGERLRLTKFGKILYNNKRKLDISLTKVHNYIEW